mmetsp:Transcript_30521/g.33811  ORF Transcript_30521/g.33811 Transcript_30521/m.33811 type:complete len:336 (+) Transcript_30521:54-1061(+)|eukprot:CAMPEP_0194141888 /NCGR_PEP_ID=MMETSP0152-20130528/11248_1 /TAXON_ID=1049557 /ORGANISM="Thalassiothrix antarctica, Strain L6-D1" /LENGTH=335 /DNA_ID=CAMNT_0038840661 /DNA_START=31 /DNA_END=1038 /DNA_ORIENTATION=-
MVQMTRRNSRETSRVTRLVIFVIVGFFLLLFALDFFNSPPVVGTNYDLAAIKAKTSEEIVVKGTKPEEPSVVAVSIPEKSKSHHCLNEDFEPQNPVGVWTMLNDNSAYVNGALKLGRAIKARTITPVDLVVMELQSKPLTESQWKDLTEVGFHKCMVSSIPPPDVGKTRKDLREKFAVLHVWAMEIYDRVLFLDADTFVQNSLDPLISIDLQGKSLGVTKDIRERKWVQTFNSGVMVLKPSMAEHERLLKLLRSGIKFDFIMSDQGFLNEVYKDDWHEIGFVNNANLALYRFQRTFWDQHKLEDINIIHYTMSKPWKCSSKGPYGPICDVWINAK